MVRVNSWGRLDAPEHLVRAVHWANDLQPPGQGTALPVGLGRSYGDVGLNSHQGLWQMDTLDRLLSFDPNTGRLTCQAGTSLATLQRLMVPRGWMLPVTPGTQWVTVGGAIANDVHGKNHHRQGSLGAHISRLVLWRTNGETIECGPQVRRDWWEATVGGLGLTGVILEADIQLKAVAGPWLEVETLVFATLEEFFTLSAQSEAEWEHTVAWVDCGRHRGRGILFRGNGVPLEGPNTARPGSWQLPFTPPVSLINRLSSEAFNQMYFQYHRSRTGKRIVHYQPFFYPLDSVSHWNRLYGPHGFYQYQLVVPPATALEVARAVLEVVGRQGEASPLTVLKTFGDQPSVGMLSFAQPGLTLAIDFPNRGTRTLRLLDQLDALVQQAGGRLYPAKDARMARSFFEKSYPRLPEFLNYRDRGISSDLSRRLMGY